jgi:hypothetical protein
MPAEAGATARDAGEPAAGSAFAGIEQDAPSLDFLGTAIDQTEAEIDHAEKLMQTWLLRSRRLLRDFKSMPRDAALDAAPQSVDDRTQNAFPIFGRSTTQVSATSLIVFVSRLPASDRARNWTKYSAVYPLSQRLLTKLLQIPMSQDSESDQDASSWSRSSRPLQKYPKTISGPCACAEV